MIDILLAAYNGEPYISKLLDSLYNQTYKDFRVIAADDGSTDKTMELLTSFAQKQADFSVVVNDPPTGSAKMNFFQLLLRTSSEYVMFADHDDVWKSTKIEHTFLEMKKLEDRFGREKPILVHTDLSVVDENLSSVSPSLMQMQNMNPAHKTINKLLAQNNVTGCTVMVNRALVEKIKIENAGNIIMHDWWLALIASAFGTISFLPEPTILYRQHTKNQVGAKDVKSKQYIANKLKNTGSIRESLVKTYEQANEFFTVYQNELSADQAEIVLSYAQFCDLSKWKKWQRLRKYDFYKNGAIRIIGQFLLG